MSKMEAFLSLETVFILSERLWKLAKRNETPLYYGDVLAPGGLAPRMRLKVLLMSCRQSIFTHIDPTFTSPSTTFTEIVYVVFLIITGIHGETEDSIWSSKFNDPSVINTTPRVSQWRGRFIVPRPMRTTAPRRHGNPTLGPPVNRCTRTHH